MQERRALTANVFFADTDPQIHPSWNQHKLDALVDSTFTYNVSDEQMERLGCLERDQQGLVVSQYATGIMLTTGVVSILLSITKRVHMDTRIFLD